MSNIDNTAMKTRKFHDVWYIPKFTKNLVSGPQLLNKGFEIHSSERGLGIYIRDNILLATTRIEGRLLCFNISRLENCCNGRARYEMLRYIT